jgi:ketosteroid isomerase-like protein
MTPEEVVFAFVEAINSRRVDRISELMTHDHVFIESDGEEVAGRERMRDAWAAYFKMVPDYRIQVTETLTRDNTVVPRRPAR